MGIMGCYDVEIECVTVSDGAGRIKKETVVTSNVYRPALLMSICARYDTLELSPGRNTWYALADIQHPLTVTACVAKETPPALSRVNFLTRPKMALLQEGICDSIEKPTLPELPDFAERSANSSSSSASYDFILDFRTGVFLLLRVPRLVMVVFARAVGRSLLRANFKYFVWYFWLTGK